MSVNRPHAYEGRKPRKYQGYVAMVEGQQNGVLFRTFYKRMATAEKDAEATGATLTDLRTLKRRVPIIHKGQGWRQTEWRDA